MKTKPIRIIGFTLIFIVLLAAFLYSEEKQTENENVCIWKIKSDNNTVYLLGSIHFLNQADYPLDDRYDQCFEYAENVVFELNFDSTQTPAFQQYTLLKAFYPQGETFQGSVSDSTYTLVKNKLLELGMPVEKLNTLQPWFIAITMLSLNLQKLGFDPTLGVDQHFFELAKEAQKNIIGLESPEFQLDLLATLGGEDQEDFIVKSIDQFDEMESSIHDLVDAWDVGDLEKLDELLNKGFEEYPALKQSLLIDRNYNWLDDVIEYTKDNEDYLVIVGSGHLAGEEGLIKLLKAQGYSVERF
ncbi:MAG: TraB/GumN family protein [Candidatus Celaenobacter polaris]|nr:TraB/GumN family protein [Candidatus Celaenobacter polaris]